METATVRDLKNKTSAILRRAAGRDVLITSRSKPVACLTAVSIDDLSLHSPRLASRDALADSEVESMINVAVRLWRIPREKNRRWISQGHHDEVLYGSGAK